MVNNPFLMYTFEHVYTLYSPGGERCISHAMSSSKIAIEEQKENSSTPATKAFFTLFQRASVLTKTRTM